MSGEAKFTPGPWTFRQSVYNGGAYDVHYSIETVDKQPEHPWSPRVVAWMTGGIRNDLSLNSIPSAKYCKECSRWHLYDREIGVDTRRDLKIEADCALIAAAPTLYEALQAAVEIIDKWIEPETMGVVRSGDGVLGHYLRDEYLMNFRAALSRALPQGTEEGR